uniref:Telomerase reverse transcriptase n=1 Tax=Salarias fasciatus TaxID=181472 RepID=A0A672GU47_SALFA
LDGMSSSDFSAVLDILRVLYQHVQTLEEFADGIVFREGRRAALVEPSDTSRFKTFVRSVCNQVTPPDFTRIHVISTLPELLAFVVNNLKRKKKRNVLAHGYHFLSLAQEDRDADTFKFQGDVTQSAAYIHGSDLWKRITIRLGTDITRYLLESCSVFVAVPPSCAFQVCGGPVHDRVSITTTPSGFCLQSKYRRHITMHRGLTTSKKGNTVENRVESRKKRRAAARIEKKKRKREADQSDEATSRKRRRVSYGKHGVEIQQEETQTKSACSTPSIKPVETSAVSFKPSVEAAAAAAAQHVVEGGPSWRSGIFPPLPPSHCFIRTLGLLYGGRGLRGFLLNRKKKTADGTARLQGKDLIRIVFFEGLAYLNGLQRKPKKPPRRFFNMIPLFNQLLKWHKMCPYSKILQRFCPVVKDHSASQAEMNSLLPLHCAPHRVYLFVRECLSAVIPQELWGSDHNRINFFVKVKGFLHSGKFERLSLAELMWKMKVNDCDWTKLSKTGRVPPSELAYRTQILGQFFAWLLDGYVVGLVRACFYVTESLGKKNALRFYRQEVWTKLQDLAFRGHLLKGQMEELTPAQVASLPKDTVVSRLRFIPKADGMRPITRVVGNTLYSLDLLDMLRACVRSTPSLQGFTVWGLADIHKVLCRVAPAQKEKPQSLYFVKVDVSGAYESLPHDKLMEVITQALAPVQDKFFTIRRYSKIWKDSHEGLKKAFVRQEDNMSSTNMKGFLMALQGSGKVHHSILVEDNVVFLIGVWGELFKSLSLLLCRTYRQCRGIPQGSVVSTLLCCLCYGHMENALFKDSAESRGCLMRLVDDFLLITPDQHKAEAFLKIFLAGVPQYGVVVNPQKVAVNFEVSASVGSCPGIRVMPSHCLFPWCGLLLDTRSLDVYKDYSSYAGLSLRYSLTLGSFHSAGQQMRRKLIAVLRLNCRCLFLDLKVNSLETVYKNIYKLVLLHACRFHVCAQSLPFGQMVAKNPAYFLQMIWDMAQFTNKTIRLSNKGTASDSNFRIKPPVEEYFFLFTFPSFLIKSVESVFLIFPGKRSLERRLGDLRLARVRQAATPRIPTDFLAIRM